MQLAREVKKMLKGQGLRELRELCSGGEVTYLTKCNFLCVTVLKFLYLKFVLNGSVMVT